MLFLRFLLLNFFDYLHKSFAWASSVPGKIIYTTDVEEAETSMPPTVPSRISNLSSLILMDPSQRVDEELIREHDKVMLDKVDRYMKDGEHRKANDYAKARERKLTHRLNHDSVNSVAYEEYRLMQTKQGKTRLVDLDEVEDPFYEPVAKHTQSGYRHLAGSLDEALEAPRSALKAINAAHIRGMTALEDNLKRLWEKYDERYLLLQKAQHRLVTELENAPGLLAAAQEDLDAQLAEIPAIAFIKNRLGKLESTLKEDRKRMYDLEVEYLQLLSSRQEAKYNPELPQLSETEQLEKDTQIVTIKKQFEELKAAIERDERRITALSNKYYFFLSLESAVKRCQELIDHPEILLAEIDELKKSEGSLVKDTEKRRAKEEKKIAFILSHPHLFVLPAGDRFTLQGVNEKFCSIEWTDPITNKKCVIEQPAKDALITVLDTDPSLCNEGTINRFLRHRISNLGQKYSYRPQFSMDGNLNPEHAIFVSGMIVLEQNSNGELVGIAPSAQVELIPINVISSMFQPKANIGISVDDQMPVYDSAFYSAILDQFTAGKRSFRTPPMTIEHEELTRELVHGDIVNLSITYMPIDRWNIISFGRSEIGLGELFFWWKLCAIDGRLLVKAAGNQALQAGSEVLFRFMKAMAIHESTRERFLMVTNLHVDGLHLHPTSSEPGDHYGLQRRTLSAIGSGVPLLQNCPFDERETKPGYGTSYAAPFVSGLAAIIHTEFPSLPLAAVAHCLLDSATPIVLTGEIAGFKTPHALKLMAYELCEGTYLDVDSGRPVDVTAAMIAESRRIYGKGRVHLANALGLAKILSAASRLADEDSGIKLALEKRDYDDLHWLLKLS